MEQLLASVNASSGELARISAGLAATAVLFLVVGVWAVIRYFWPGLFSRPRITPMLSLLSVAAAVVVYLGVYNTQS